MKKLLKSSLAAALAAVIFAGSMPYTAVNVSADSNEIVNVQAADSNVDTGLWGTCKWTYDNGTLTIGGGTVLKSGTWVSYAPSIEKVVISEKITFEKGASLRALFQNMSSLKTVEGLGNLDISNVTDMSFMFDGCSSLTELDMDGLDTSNVTDMRYMFSGCELLTQLNVSGFDTSNVTNMSSMFSMCSSLTELNVSNFNTSKVTSMAYMFYSCGSLTTLDVTGFDTSNVTDMRCLFTSCRALTKLNIEGFDTSNVTNMKYMFLNCNSLTELNVSNFNTSKVTDMSFMFAGCILLTELNVSGFDTSKVVNMSYMFDECKTLTALDVTGFDTANVTNMSNMFLRCEKIKDLDVSKFNTSKVQDLSWMFADCKQLKNIDVSKFDTSNVTNMAGMFTRVASEELDVSNFDTSKVTDMSAMFSGCKSLKKLDVSKFDTSNVTDMSGMFNQVQCEELDVSNFDTSKVTDMGYMFAEADKLKHLDMSSFDTSNVTKMYEMFFNCSSLYKLDISGFDMSKVNNMNNMFAVSDFVSIKTPAKFPEDRNTFVQELKSGVKMGKWIDRTTGTEYKSIFSLDAVEGHTYTYLTEKLNADVTVSGTAAGNQLSVQVKGGMPDYTYRYIMYNPNSDKWTLLSDYSSSNTYTLNMTGFGNRIIYVDVKDLLGDVTRASATVTLTGQEALSVTASKNESDNQVVFTANAAGGTSGYTYKFIVYNKTTGTWGVVQNYSDKNTCTWTKGSAGDRDFYVDVKDSDGNVVRSKAMNVKIESTKPTAVLTPSATTLSTGGKLTLTASTDKSGCTYKFLIYNPSTNQWFKLQDFSSKNTYTWTAGSNGTRQFYVDVKDANGNVTRSKVVNVTIGGEGALSVKTAVSANTTKVGDNVTFTAEGAGGKAGYTYKMVVYNKTTKTWGLVQNFNANNKITWTAGSTGDREFYIDVKDADGNVVRSSVMNVKTTN